ncbi:hypothetical protein D9615_000605 [Tricholomella constricta]|uniref:1,4-alpha-glucan-branching enzyme n=1 Tax=Tricholomella constricta TaxID=117010 RepID=A0A8H5HQQ8_9AGAR|nr:hypothetical protein D9615_000605 [Tricholomella constricta]
MAEEKSIEISPASRPSSNPPAEVQPLTPEGRQDTLTTPPPTAVVSDRSELLSRARVFLQSPQILHQDTLAKRSFLAEKGLNEMEIDGLLRELPLQRPLVPPRTYPQQPPSNLPTLLLGLIRLFSWIAGGSAALIFIYYRFLLPRITQTTLARRSIKSHHLSLLRRLNESLTSLKESQKESYSVLPRPEPFKEPARYQACHSVVDMLKEIGDKAADMENIPPVTLIRCGLESFGEGKEGDLSKPTTEELFQYLEGQVPWLASEDGLKYEQKLWETLSTCPLFIGTPSLPTSNAENFEDQKPTRWTYAAPEPAEPSPVSESMNALSRSLPKSSAPQHNSRQHTLQALAEFTGYISTQVYMPYRPPSSAAGFLGSGGSLGPAEDEFRREIRALKGLVLNRKWKDTIEQSEGGYDSFTKGYLKFGFNVAKDGQVVYREWAPNATEANLIGDFNEWSRTSHPMKKDNYGVWEITILPTSPGVSAIPHDSKIKISMLLPTGQRIERLPAWIKRVTQDLSVSPVYDARFWNPPESETYKFKNPRPPKPTNLRIYEAHVGISTSEPRVGTYSEFTRNILPRIKDLGYNVIQLMAVMEHAYYASFGYQVTSFFAASSRYGSPEDLKELIDTAHGMGLTVLLDIVHSHACKNVLDGLNEFDGTDHLYFHEGSKGRHELWDSRLFNYSQHEVLRFLMSNLRFYMDVFQFDGFRFDGVTSMMYKHHGIGTGFSGGYHEYFGEAADIEAIVYLMLANDAIHSLYPNAITIAEDVSGMPLLGAPVDKGGVGFDYRLSMAIPDMWIKLLKHKSDDEWNIGNIVFTLTNRRYGEKSIAYCESHDQALVGDKTLAFWLMDKEMYTNMSDMTEMTPVISRGLALHKMIRLLTHSLGGEGYLNFEGNEFGHPEACHMPCLHQNSFHYARRQWNVVDDSLLRYRYLNNFDRAMNHLAGNTGWLESPQVKAYGKDYSPNSNPLASMQAYVSLKNEADKVIVYERAGLLFIFNFNPTQSFTDYRVGVEEAAEYRIVLSSDEQRFGGFDNVKLNVKFITTPMEWNNRKNWLQVYIPARTGLVLSK